MVPRTDDDMIGLAKSELSSLGFLEGDDVMDAAVVRMPKAYPAYVGAYDCFPELSAWSNEFDNLFLIGRNGMHKYNNQDHSMLTAMIAVDNIVANVRCRDNLWALNTDKTTRDRSLRTGHHRSLAAQRRVVTSPLLQRRRNAEVAGEDPLHEVDH